MDADARQKEVRLALTYRFERYVSNARAAPVGKPECRPRRCSGGERRTEAHILDACMKLAFQRFQSAEEPQAALDFGKQRPRRLERDLRRELAGPGGDRRGRAPRRGGGSKGGRTHGTR